MAITLPLSHRIEVYAFSWGFYKIFLAVAYLTSRLCNQTVIYFMASDTLSLTFSALADPTRRAILARLTTGEASVTELAAPFKMSMPAISKHLKVLERAFLIARGREAQWRPCRIEAAPLKDVSDWVEHYRVMWEERFDRLDDYLRVLKKEHQKELKNKEKKHARKKK
jgi:DNA-binding transcriptional ArsR family regulator